MNILTTNGITVAVYNEYLPEYSQPRAGKFVFGYFISIENGSPHTVQLLRRHWVIQQASGEVREVKGEGVVGLQPVIEPGASHEYTSHCELYSDIGRMSGNYLMRRCDDDSLFEVSIPAFQLVAPFKLN